MESRPLRPDVTLARLTVRFMGRQSRQLEYMLRAQKQRHAAKQDEEVTRKSIQYTFNRMRRELAIHPTLCSEEDE